MYQIYPMTREAAREIQKWVYEKPYSLYCFSGDDEELDELMSGSYVSVWNDNHLVGYFCFGEPAKVPAGIKEGVYEENHIDIGLGMHPTETGKGKGLTFLQAGLDYAIRAHLASSFRLTVASFNQRARKVYEREGFGYIQSFVNHTGERPIPFDVMVKMN
ncbi:GNAT family N-acetyltransferase [Pseudalkalibacillus hwajinpoensis]|uniref:GNAT family N-acetyltransferase n=1 Tax=Guptibacillus hwajinpoensis TaxID=208199 RepID=UPI00325B6589